MWQRLNKLIHPAELRPFIARHPVFEWKQLGPKGMLIMWAGGGNASGSASADVPSPASAAAPSPASAIASGGNAPGSASAAAPSPADASARPADAAAASPSPAGAAAASAAPAFANARQSGPHQPVPRFGHQGQGTGSGNKIQTQTSASQAAASLPPPRGPPAPPFPTQLLGSASHAKQTNKMLDASKLAIANAPAPEDPEDSAPGSASAAAARLASLAGWLQPSGDASAAAQGSTSAAAPGPTSGQALRVRLQAAAPVLTVAAMTDANALAPEDPDDFFSCTASLADDPEDNAPGSASAAAARPASLADYLQPSGDASAAAPGSASAAAPGSAIP